MSDRRRHDEEPTVISDHKRTLVISTDKRVGGVKASTIQEEGGGEVTKYID
jgi:hypothetical protein